MTRRGKIILWRVLGIVGIPFAFVGVVFGALLLLFWPQNAEKWAEETRSIIIEQDIGAQGDRLFMITEIIGDQWELACRMASYETLQDVLKQSKDDFPLLVQFESYEGKSAFESLLDGISAIAAFDVEEQYVTIFLFMSNRFISDEFCFDPNSMEFLKEEAGTPTIFSWAIN